MRKKTFHIVSLGCANNTVDSDCMAQLLTGLGYTAATDPRRARVLIVNTCGFIGTAKEESLNELGELAARKKNGQVLIAAGCLTQRYGTEVNRRVPGINGIIGTRRWMEYSPEDSNEQIVSDFIAGVTLERKKEGFKCLKRLTR